MFIYAHPDDVDFSAGGTAAKWARHGAEVIYLILTDGNAGSHEAGITAEELARIRRAEQTAAAQVTGASCVFLGQQDCMLEPSLAVRKEIVRYLRTYRPSAVVCGDPRYFFYGDRYINHPDHRAAAVVALEAVFPAAELNLLYPDLVAEGLTGHRVNYVLIATMRDANYYVDTTETIETKIEALRKHESQLKDWDPGPRMRERAVEVGKEAGFDYAESFLRITIHEPEPEEE
jgi:LmbE family N-acetylglucosaminyl deacetylase